MRQYPARYNNMAALIRAFEEYEARSETDFGDEPDDFLPWLECFEAGYEAGGNSES